MPRSSERERYEEQPPFNDSYDSNNGIIVTSHSNEDRTYDTGSPKSENQTMEEVIHKKKREKSAGIITSGYR
jgi:hypothetical protein